MGLGLSIVETRASTLLKTSFGCAVANVYLAGWDAFEVPLGPLRERGFVIGADAALVQVRAMTTKPLTETNPNVPTDDAITNWGELSSLIGQLARVYLEFESRDALGE